MGNHYNYNAMDAPRGLSPNTGPCPSVIILHLQERAQLSNEGIGKMSQMELFIASTRQFHFKLDMMGNQLKDFTVNSTALAAIKLILKLKKEDFTNSKGI